MGRISIFICSRCGATYDAQDEKWFENKYGERVHYCPDGVIGGRIEWDNNNPKRPQIDMEESLKAKCPVCGELLVDCLSTDIHFFPQQNINTPKADSWQRCPVCMIGRPLDNKDWYFLDISQYYDSGPGDAMRLVQHLNMVRCLSGYAIPTLGIAKALAFNQNSLNHLLGNTRTGKKMPIYCGTCDGEMKLKPFGDNGDYRDVSSMATIWARGNFAIAGYEASFTLECHDCGRWDYYSYNSSRDVWVWTLSDFTEVGKVDYERWGLACHGKNFGQLSEDDLEKLRNMKPVYGDVSDLVASDVRSGGNIDSAESSDPSVLAHKLRKIMGNG